MARDDEPGETNAVSAPQGAAGAATGPRGTPVPLQFGPAPWVTVR